MTDETADVPATPPDQKAPQEKSPDQKAPGATLDKKKSIILGLIGLVVIVIIFVKVIPQVGSYSAALDALENMSFLALVLVGLSVLLYLGVYGLTFMAAAPGLGYWRGQQVNQAAFTISNGVPAGGAFGLGVQYGMLTSFGITPTATTAAISAVGVWSIFVTLGFPILGVAALVVSGENGGPYVLTALIGLGILLAMIVVFALIMRSESFAAWLGRLGNKLVQPLMRRFRHDDEFDLVPMTLKFRHDIVDLVRRRWAGITAAQLSIALTQFLILYFALRGVEGWDNAGTAIGVAFAAFGISQLGLMIPITPGGLGTVDAAMIALMVSFGVDEGTATAADLIWRAVSYVPQIIIGLVALIAWYRGFAKKLASGESVSGSSATGSSDGSSDGAQTAS